MSGYLLAVACFMNLRLQVLFMAFNLFGKKDKGEKSGIFSDKTYISTAAKMNACLQLAKKQPNTLFICWFPDTAYQFKESFSANGLDEKFYY